MNNNRVIAAVMACALSALPVRAGVLTRIDPTKTADVSGQIINPGNVNLKTLPGKYYQSPRSAVSDQRVPERRAAMTYWEMHTVNLPMSSQPMVPQQNFSTRSAAASDQMRPTELVKTPTPPITKRTIHATTPAGQEELKDQLKKVPYRTTAP